MENTTSKKYQDECFDMLKEIANTNERQSQLLDLKHKLVDNLSAYYMKHDLSTSEYKECLNVINHLTDLSMTNKMMLGLFNKWLLVGGYGKLGIIYDLTKFKAGFEVLNIVNSKGVDNA